MRCGLLALASGGSYRAIACGGRHRCSGARHRPLLRWYVRGAFCGGTVLGGLWQVVVHSVAAGGQSAANSVQAGDRLLRIVRPHPARDGRSVRRSRLV